MIAFQISELVARGAAKSNLLRYRTQSSDDDAGLLNVISPSHDDENAIQEGSGASATDPSLMANTVVHVVVRTLDVAPKWIKYDVIGK